MGRDIIGLVLQSLTLIFLGLSMIFQSLLKKNDEKIFDIMKNHLNLINVLNEKIKILEKRIEELEKKNKKSPKTTVKNVSSK